MLYSTMFCTHLQCPPALFPELENGSRQAAAAAIFSAVCIMGLMESKCKANPIRVRGVCRSRAEISYNYIIIVMYKLYSYMYMWFE